MIGRILLEGGIKGRLTKVRVVQHARGLQSVSRLASRAFISG